MDLNRLSHEVTQTAAALEHYSSSQLPMWLHQWGLSCPISGGQRQNHHHRSVLPARGPLAKWGTSRQIWSPTRLLSACRAGFTFANGYCADACMLACFRDRLIQFKRTINYTIDLSCRMKRILPRSISLYPLWVEFGRWAQVWKFTLQVSEFKCGRGKKKKKEAKTREKYSENCKVIAYWIVSWECCH